MIININVFLNSVYTWKSPFFWIFETIELNAQNIFKSGIINNHNNNLTIYETDFFYKQLDINKTFNNCEKDKIMDILHREKNSVYDLRNKFDLIILSLGRF